MDPGNVGIGNYKGVMLCNRPFGGVSSSKKEASGEAKVGGNFRAGKVPDEMGLKPLRDFPKPMRFRKETALTKHKKWLVELQQTKDELEAKYLAEMERKEAQKAKFRANEDKLRAQARAIRQANYEKAKAEGKTGHTTEKTNERNIGKNKKKVAPKWKLSKAHAEGVESEEKEAEEDELLQFAESLNFDEYIHDVEVKTMIEAVQKRIKELEKCKQTDEQNEDLRMQEKVTRLLQAQKAQQNNNNSSNQVELTEEELEELAEGFDVEEMEARMATEESKDDIIGMAKSVLNEEDNMKKVHSTKSVAAIAKKTKNDYQDESKDEPYQEIANPKIVTIQEDDHSRVKDKGASRLAYLNRNPAV